MTIHSPFLCIMLAASVFPAAFSQEEKKAEEPPLVIPEEHYLLQIQPGVLGKQLDVKQTVPRKDILRFLRENDSFSPAAEEFLREINSEMWLNLWSSGDIALEHIDGKTELLSANSKVKDPDSAGYRKDHPEYAEHYRGLLDSKEPLEGGRKTLTVMEASVCEAVNSLNSIIASELQKKDFEGAGRNAELALRFVSRSLDLREISSHAVFENPLYRTPDQLGNLMSVLPEQSPFGAERNCELAELAETVRGKYLAACAERKEMNLPADPATSEAVFRHAAEYFRSELGQQP